MLAALQHGVVPRWTAGNAISKQLAMSIGYRPGPLLFTLDCDGAVISSPTPVFQTLIPGSVTKDGDECGKAIQKGKEVVE